MTEEELEKEADKYADNYATPDLDCSFRAHMFEASKEGYLAGAEPREKRIAELEEQIENMKCCGNCEHATHDSMNGTYCDYYSEWEHADLKCTQWEL